MLKISRPQKSPDPARWLRACWLALPFFLTACGATVSTRLEPLTILRSPPRVAVATNGQVSQRLKPDAMARALETWADNDPARLTQASNLILAQAKAPPVIFTNKVNGFALMAARLAWQSLEQAETTDGLAAYNAALSTFVETQSTTLAAGRPETPVTTPAGPVAVRMKWNGPVGAGYFDRLLVAERVRVNGFRERATIPGLGVPLVGQRDRKPERKAEMEWNPERGVALAATCVARFSRGGVELEIVDPMRKDQVKIHGRARMLAADFTAPLAFSFGGANDLLLGIRNLFNVSVGMEDAGIFLAGPFDPNRIPVVLIHGLSSSPIVWRNVVSEAMRDPVIRRNYQFWYAYYPTGAPMIFSAELIRSDIALIRRQGDPRGTARASRQMTLVGYSMGGVIARILTTNMGDRLWNTLTDVPFNEVKFEKADRETIRNAIIWRAVPGVDRVIFIATPHRGTRMADASFAHFASRLIQLPGDILQLQQRAFHTLWYVLRENVTLPDRATGINGLSKGSPLFLAMEDAPFAPGVKYNSIVGDRGRGDSPDSSDGIVGYWSSHLAGAESELIVPTGHDAQASPQTEAEIRRILVRNLHR